MSHFRRATSICSLKMLTAIGCLLLSEKIGPLSQRFKVVEVPMKGLMMGEQLSWLSKKLKED
ncbi:hypothetical protein SAMN05443247_08674 [Bradyrhizobium erythrophlei]|jgi:hypothetical protein|nr:hypothetical protein SAMN05443247_08674 [Bradyrhizobium erythrophlei]